MAETHNLAGWERTEAERSAREASETGLDQLRTAPLEIARYMNPPGDTCFPLEYAYHLLGDVRDKTVLDFGCGNGENTLLLAKRGAQVLSMDLSKSLLELAQRRLEINGVWEDVRFLSGSAHDIPLRDESVDVVFGIAVLHHLDLAAAAREIYRVLRRDGRAVFQEPVRNSKLLRALRKLVPYRHPNASAFERPLTDGEIKAFTHSFSLGRERAFHLPHVRLARRLPVSRKLVKNIVELDARTLSRFPALSHYASIKVFELMK